MAKKKANASKKQNAKKAPRKSKASRKQNVNAAKKPRMPVIKKRNEVLAAIKKSATDLDFVGAAKHCWELQSWIKDHLALSPQVLKKSLDQANDEQDYKQVGELVDQLMHCLRDGSTVYEPEDAKSVLEVLKGARCFDALSKLADVFIATGMIDDCDESVNCLLLYVQALIDSGRVEPAILLLTKLDGKIKKLVKQHGIEKIKKQCSECAGLFGRAFKQLYVDNAELTGNRTESYLNLSIENYKRIYFDPAFADYGDRTWHGINIASVARRAKFDGIKIKSGTIDSRALAKEVLQIVEARKNVQPRNRWDNGTALEASVLVGNFDGALKCAGEYCAQKDAQFMYASTLRQLEELFQVDPNDPAISKILRLLRAMHLKENEDANIHIIDPKAESTFVNDLMRSWKSDGFEAVLGDTEYKALEWYKMGLDRASAVGKISNLVGSPKGTGFLIRGADVDSSLGSELVLITNSHVVSEDHQEQTARPPEPRSIAPDNASVTFHAVSSNKEYRFETPIHRNSHRNNLDYSILRFKDAPTEIDPLPIVTTGPDNNEKQRVYIIGHPQGGGLSFSIQDNRLTGYDPSASNPTKVLYRTPTCAGSSGSPVFNAEWKVFALHHKTEGGNNRGIMFSRIAPDV